MRTDLPTVEEIHQLFDYDPLTGLFRWRVRNSRCCRQGWFPGSNKGRGYLTVSIKGLNYGAHRIAWVHHYGEWPASALDHIDGVRGNNRIANLRPATPQENARNRKRHTNTRSGLKGVYEEPNGRWRAQFCVNGRHRYLGLFDTADEARTAYNAAVQESFGEFARTA